MACLVAAVGGSIFGYDIGISGGVTSMDPFLEKFFPVVYRKKNLQSQNNYCKYDNQGLAAFTSSLYLAGLVASIVASPVTRKYGRRASIVCGGVSFLVGAALKLPPSTWRCCFWAVSCLVLVLASGIRQSLSTSLRWLPPTSEAH
ncbi:unnamed protein product [Musa acuminata var. zebrina]